MSELFRLAKLQGVHTTLDTAGQPYTTAEPFYSKFETLMQNTDLVMLDLKAFYPDRHKALTGCDNTPILDMRAGWANTAKHVDPPCSGARADGR